MMKNKYSKLIQGLTLIELIVVLMISAIMAVTVFPKFMSSDGFEEFTYRNEIITTLRAIQLRAMQQTTNDVCHQVTVSSTRIGLNSTDNSANFCNDGAWHDASSSLEDTTGVTVESGHNVFFSLSGGSRFSFNQLGKPVGCSTPCQITVTGQQALEIIIESEGYIHAL